MKSFLEITQENKNRAVDHIEDIKSIFNESLLSENDDRYGMFKAIFVSGGPGSGKDLIIREAIDTQNATELNTTIALSLLQDKHKLSEQSKDFRREAVRTRQPLIINGTTNEYSSICSIKEELEDLGYETMMIFVNTTNESSQKRNQKLTRMLPEEVRFNRWLSTQRISEKFNDIFDKCLEFDNSLDINEATQEEIEVKRNDIDIISTMTQWFYSSPIQNEIAEMWLQRNSRSRVELKLEQFARRTEQTIKEKLNAAKIKTNSKTLSTEGANCTCSSTNGTSKGGTSRRKLKLTDNICPSCQLTAKQGRSDSVTDGDIASNTKYTFRTYHEGSEPTFTYKGPEKEPRFQQDNDKSKAKKYKSKAEAGKVLKVPGLSPEYDTRGSGTVYPMSGLGNVTYKEQVDDKYVSTAEVTRKSFSKFRKEAIDSPSVEMGVTGGYHGPSNKEPLETQQDRVLNQVSNIKKKKKHEKV
jgi:predicted kinase